MFSEETLKSMEKVLDQAIKVRNTISESEFIRFKPLFTKNELSQAQQLDLCKEYQSKVSLFHPVEIVNTLGEVLLRLPAMFNEVNSINNSKAKDPVLALRAFTNAINRDAELTTDKEQATLTLINTIGLTKDPSKINKSLQQHTNIMEELIKAKREDVSYPDVDNLTTVRL